MAGTIAVGIIAAGCVLIGCYLGFGWAEAVVVAVIMVGCALAGRPWLVRLFRDGAHAGTFFRSLVWLVLSASFLIEVLAIA